MRADRRIPGASLRGEHWALMSWVDEKLTERFYQWELRGRGWQIFESPVLPEPPFQEFDGHYLPQTKTADDGRRPTAISHFVESFRFDSTQKADHADAPQGSKEQGPVPFERDQIIEVGVTLPPDAAIPRETLEEFLFNLSACDEPIAFEVVASADQIRVQFASSTADALMLKKFLQTYFPAAVVTLQDNQLPVLWHTGSGRDFSIFQFGLEQEFMIPLSSSRPDFIAALIGTLSDLNGDEVAVFQILFQPVQWPWARSTLRAVSDDDGNPFFSNRPELLVGAKAKIARPLYATVVRVAVAARDYHRRVKIMRTLESVLTSLIEPTGNTLMLLDADGYTSSEQEEDLLRRQSRRAGMILNSNELLLLLNLPSPAVQSAKLVRQINKTRSAPTSLREGTGSQLGVNVHGGQTTSVRLNREQRVRHVHVIGASGSGKSTLLFNLIRQDIENGEGVALLDPHGDLADRVLNIIPRARVKDVIVVDPSDESHSVGFNILSASSDLERTLLASDLISVFQRLSTSWGDQMSSVLQNAILAFLESDRGGTLAELRRFLLEPAYRNEFLKSVRDPEVVYYWNKAFPHLTGSKSIGPILTRLETFLSPKPIRLMVSQAKNRLDFREIMDGGKIFIAKLAQGLIGRENAYLLGSIFVSKLQQTAMARQSRPQEERRDFWLYVDEFHHFVTPSMGEILAAARKYRLGLTLAHQELRQLHRDDEVGSAVLSNPYTRIVFRVGDADARVLGDGFTHFGSEDLRNLDTGRAICRVERSDYDFNLAVPLPESRPHLVETATREEIIASSRSKYATLRAEVESNLSVSIISTEPPTPVPSPPAPALVAQPLTKVIVTSPISPVTVQTTPLPKEQPRKSVSPESRVLGKGGQEHKRLQLMVKQWAQGMGYRATIEEQLAAGGQVDVSLKKSKRTIACEISITTPNANEADNVRKCIDAGYDFIMIISPDAKRVAELELAIVPTLAKCEQAKVRFFSTPDALFTFVEDLDARDGNREETVRGYRVKVKHQVVDKTSKADRTKILAKIIGDSMARKKTNP
jgi:hypothetical protein